LASCTVDATDAFDGSDLKPNVEEGDASYRQTGDGFVVLQEWKFTGEPQTSSARPVLITATFELTYEAESELTDEIFAVFRRFNLPVNVWPFFREFVHTVLARVNWPVFLLPALKIGTRSTKPPRRTRQRPAKSPT
jgi:hypothetical protein